MVATWQPAAPAAYYKNQTAYYAGGIEPRGAWFALAGDFGLVDGGEVDVDKFERLLCAIGDNGQSLIAQQRGRAADRRPAFDITFSAPRSASLAWAFGSAEEQQAIEAAQERAVRAALAMLEREATFARRGRNGERVERVALSAALFRHGDSRPAEHADGRRFGDPNLHTHAVVLSLATRADGSVGALHSIEQRNFKMAAGAAYHAALASELHALGYAIDRVGYNGVFEIAGVDDETIRYFSARRQEIETELEKHGARDKHAAALAAAIAKSTRGAKNAGVSQGREEIWKEAARARGVDVANFTSALRAEKPFDRAAGEALFAARLAELPDELTKSQSVFDRKDLVQATAAALVGSGLPLTRVDAEIAKLTTAGAIVEIGADKVGRPRYSTPELLRIERETVACAARMAEKSQFGLDAVRVRVACKFAGLSQEQTEAALGATTPGAIAVISGAPGSGKTTTLKPIVEAYQSAGHRVIGAASAWRVANALRDDLAIPSRALASWLEKLNNGAEFLARGDVLVVDEAGLLDSRETHKLLSHAEAVGAKVLFLGDCKQLDSIGSASGLGLVEHTLDALRVDTIVRQRDEWARGAIRRFGDGRASAALEAFAARGKLVEAEGGKAAIDAIVDQWRQSRQGDRAEGPLLLARTNADVAAISRSLREILRTEGKIVGPEVEIATVTPSGQSTAVSLARGDHIRFLARNDTLGVVNGTTAKILGIRDKRLWPTTLARKIEIEAEISGRRIKFTPEDIADSKGRAKIGWAYASTIYQSQGVTVDKAIVLVDSSFDRRQIYVAASRARNDTILVFDAKAIDRLRGAGLSPDQQRDDGRSSPDERREWLAGRLAQAKTKESTLDAVLASRERKAIQHQAPREKAVGLKAPEEFLPGGREQSWEMSLD